MTPNVTLMNCTAILEANQGTTIERVAEMKRKKKAKAIKSSRNLSTPDPNLRWLPDDTCKAKTYVQRKAESNKKKARGKVNYED